MDGITTFQIISIILSVLTLLGFGTVATIFWKDLHAKKEKDIQERSREHKEALKKERQEETSEVMQPFVDKMGKRFDTIESRMDNLDSKINKISDGTLSTLRNDILKCYYECSVDHGKGYRNDNDYINIHDLYDAYKELGGNSFVEDVMNRFDNLPTKEEFRAKLEGEKSKKAKKQALLEDK